MSNFFQKIKRRISAWQHKQKYRNGDGYDAAKYWQERHAEFSSGLRGVGNKDLSEQENAEMYRAARETFLSLCEKEQIDFSNTKILEIGYGTGFYTSIVKEMGAAHYTGVDIAKPLEASAALDFSTYQFVQMDVTQEQLSEQYDLIIMIDVTQHITEDQRFEYAMENVREHLSEEGVFIVTSSLEAAKRLSFYEVLRPLEAFQKMFPGFTFSKPTAFRDKYIFSIKR